MKIPFKARILGARISEPAFNLHQLKNVTCNDTHFILYRISIKYSINNFDNAIIRVSKSQDYSSIHIIWAIGE